MPECPAANGYTDHIKTELSPQIKCAKRGDPIQLTKGKDGKVKSPSEVPKARGGQRRLSAGNLFVICRIEDLQ